MARSGKVRDLLWQVIVAHAYSSSRQNLLKSREALVNLVVTNGFSLYSHRAVCTCESFLRRKKRDVSRWLPSSCYFIQSIALYSVSRVSIEEERKIVKNFSHTFIIVPEVLSDVSWNAFPPEALPRDRRTPTSNQPKGRSNFFHACRSMLTSSVKRFTSYGWTRTIFPPRWLRHVDCRVCDFPCRILRSSFPPGVTKSQFFFFFMSIWYWPSVRLQSSCNLDLTLIVNLK